MNRMNVFALSAGVFFAPLSMAESSMDTAHVLSAEPVYESVKKPVESKACRDQVREARSHKGDGGGAALAGAIVGGVLGHELGKGQKNEDTATAVGAIIGAAIGDTASRNASRKGTVVEKHCEITTQYVSEQYLVGYDVEYVYAGNSYSARMDHDPGRRLKVKVNVLPAE